MALIPKIAGLAKGAQTQKKKPKAMSTEGVTMLMLATTLEVINVIIGILDFAIIGIILGPIVNFAGTILIGGWLWLRTGNLSPKKSLGPLIGNSIPIVKFFPWWLVAVATSLEWKNTVGQPIQSQEQPQENNKSVQKAPVGV